jgi:hypothetical protein
MLKSRDHVPEGAKRPRPALAATAALVGCLSLLIALIVGASGAGAEQSAKTTVILGGGGSLPDPSCPDLPCRAITSVTGFQAQTPNGTLPFKVPKNTKHGKITSWTITVAQPTNSQRSFFNGFAGTPPEARISILKRVPGTKPPRYKLRRQSAIRVLSPYLGQTVKFKLGRPLPVRRGNIVALTVPTWAPAFAVGVNKQNAWRASRQRGRCFNVTDLRQGRPQQVVDSKRVYGCRYATARMLYTAPLIDNR